MLGFSQSAEWANMWGGNRDCLCRSSETPVRDERRRAGRSSSQGLGRMGNGLRVFQGTARKRMISDPPCSQFQGEGNSKSIQYPCLENPMDRGACWAAVHGMAKSRTRLSLTHTHTHTHLLTVWWCLGKWNWHLYLSNQQFLTECLLCERQYSWW